MGAEVKSAAEALVAELSDTKNAIRQPLREGEQAEDFESQQWIRFIQLLDHRRRTYGKAPILFSEMYAFYRMRELLALNGIEENVDVFAEGKDAMLRGSNDTLSEAIEEIYDFEDDGNVKADLQKLLKRCAGAGRVDMLHKHLYGDQLTVSEYTPRERVSLTLRERWLAERETKRVEIERLKKELEEKELERLRSRTRVFGGGVENQDEERDLIEKRIKALETELEDYIVKTPKATDRPQDSELTRDDVDTHFSYEGRDEERIYIGDDPPDPLYGVPDHWTDGHEPTTLLRNDAKLISEAITVSGKEGGETLLLVAGNAGLEMATDLLLVDEFFRCGVEGQDGRNVTIHFAPLNTHPSLATENDFHKALDFMASLDSKTARGIASRLKRMVDEGRIALETHNFYSTPLPFWCAPKSLQEKMNSNNFIVIKSDRAYRRLTADLLHAPYASFSRITRGVFPNATLVAIRPINFPGVSIGLPIVGVTKARRRYEQKWDVSGLLLLVQMRYKLEAGFLSKSTVAQPL